MAQSTLTAKIAYNKGWASMAPNVIKAGGNFTKKLSNEEAAEFLPYFEQGYNDKHADGAVKWATFSGELAAATEAPAEAPAEQAPAAPAEAPAAATELAKGDKVEDKDGTIWTIRRIVKGGGQARVERTVDGQQVKANRSLAYLTKK